MEDCKLDGWKRFLAPKPSKGLLHDKTPIRCQKPSLYRICGRPRVEQITRDRQLDKCSLLCSVYF